MDEKPQDKTDQGEDRVDATLHFNIPMSLSGRYAQQLMVQPVENEVVLSFFEVVPPIMLGTPEERMAVLAKGVQAICVARIVIANNRYPDFVRAMTEIMELPRFKKLEESKK